MIKEITVRAEPKGMPPKDSEALSPFERIALGLGRFMNESERVKALQYAYLANFGVAWVSRCTSNLLHVDGLERVRRLDPPGGVLMVANHRSFFDSYIISLVLLSHRIPWARHLYFPVRSNFFYESATGVAINLLIGGGTMYPPIFRDRSKAALNKLALEGLIAKLRHKGTVVGMHPEGTRGKGPDPYELLPAQPGIGEVILKARPTILPVFVNGLSNSFVGQIVSNFRSGDKRGQPIWVVFGDPVDLGDLARGNLRPALYKRVADHVLDEVRRLGARERELRAGPLRSPG